MANYETDFSPEWVTEMEIFDRRMALEVIEDALGNLETPENRGMASGYCNAFFMCGLLLQHEWKVLLERIAARDRQISGSSAGDQISHQDLH